MCRKKTFVSFAVLIMISVANAGLVLTVNGLDASMLIEIKDSNSVVVAVAGITDKQNQTYSVNCEFGGKLTPLTEVNALSNIQTTEQYLFTFEAKGALLASVNLTVDGVLDYQLDFFRMPGENTIVWGIDSDAIEIPPQNKVDDVNEISEPNEPEPPQEEQNRPLMQLSPRNTYEPPILVSCPNEVSLHRLERFAVPAGDKGGESTMGKGGYIELQEITDSLYLDPNEVYYVPYPPLLIHSLDGNSIDVVIPSGTTIILAEDWDYGIVVYDGANVHFGELAPEANEPNSIYEPSDTNSPAPLVWVVGESGSPFFNTFCGIFIDRTAGTRSKLDNIYLSGHYYGIQVDQQLDYPISNIYALGCYNGILSFGPNKILNSSVSYYGIWSSE